MAKATREIKLLSNFMGKGSTPGQFHKIFQQANRALAFLERDSVGERVCGQVSHQSGLDVERRRRGRKQPTVKP
jgi:hypothetical protein